MAALVEFHFDRVALLLEMSSQVPATAAAATSGADADGRVAHVLVAACKRRDRYHIPLLHLIQHLACPKWPICALGALWCAQLRYSSPPIPIHIPT